MYDIVVKSSRSLSHLLMSSCVYRMPQNRTICLHCETKSCPIFRTVYSETIFSDRSVTHLRPILEINEFWKSISIWRSNRQDYRDTFFQIKIANIPVSEAACSIVTARRSYASAVLGVVILSVCLSVRLSHACFVTNPKDLPAIFLYHTKGQSF